MFNKCLDDRDRDDYAPEAPGGRRQFKICAKGSCMRTVSGTAEPLHGREISELISEIIGEENLYFMGKSERRRRDDGGVCGQMETYRI